MLTLQNTTHTTRWLPLVKSRCRKRSFLINFYKENKELWSSEINSRNKEEKAAAKENLLSLFDGRYSEEFLDKTFHALRTAFNQEEM